MNIDWIIPCRYGEIHDNLGTLVGAGIDTFWIAEFPTEIQLGIAVRLLAQADELGPGQQHTVRNIIRDPDGDTVSDLSEEFSVGTAEEAVAARTEWLNGIAVFTVIKFEVPGPGTYTFEHIVDASTKSVPLHVLEAPAPGGAS